MTIELTRQSERHERTSGVDLDDAVATELFGCRTADGLSVPTIQLRAKLWITGCLMPIYLVGSAAVYGIPTMPGMWQSGELYVFASLLLRMGASWYFLPLGAVSLLALLIWIVYPNSSRWFPVRYAIYAGTILGVQFSAEALIAYHVIVLSMTALVAPILAFLVWVIYTLLSRMRRFGILEVLVLTTLVAVLTAMIQYLQLGSRVSVIFNSLSVCVLGATPILFAVSFFRSSIFVAHAEHARRLLPSAQHTSTATAASLVGQGLAVAAWGSAWLVAWRAAILAMYADYALLPTQPNCYVSSAAAGGHRWLVGSQDVWIGSKRCRVNLQMRRLKFLEFALATSLPGFHKRLRYVYNKLGPWMARHCARNPWISDGTFLVLYPLAFFANVLRRLIGLPSSVLDLAWRGDIAR